jgi:hypothetical protein
VEHVPPRDIVAPLAFLASLVGIGTVYLARFALPFVFGAAGLGLGLYAYFHTGAARQSLAAIIAGIAALFVGAVVLVLR